MAGYLKSVYSYVRPGASEASGSYTGSASAAVGDLSPRDEQPSKPDDAVDHLQQGPVHSDKKTDEKVNFDPSQPQPGLLRKTASGLSSGIYNIGAGAVGVGVGTVKWVGTTTYSMGSGVVNRTAGVVSTAVGAVGSAACVVTSKVKGKPKDKAD